MYHIKELRNRFYMYCKAVAYHWVNGMPDEVRSRKSPTYVTCNSSTHTMVQLEPMVHK